MNKRRRKADRERLRNYLWLRMYLPDGEEAAVMLFPEVHQRLQELRASGKANDAEVEDRSSDAFDSDPHVN